MGVLGVSFVCFFPCQFFQLLLYPALLHERLPGETALQDTADPGEGAYRGEEEAARQGAGEDGLVPTCSSHCASRDCFSLSGC